MATVLKPEHFMDTSGDTDPVWVHQMPYSQYPSFPKLERNIETDVCIIGCGVAGLSTAYELTTRGKKVAILEGRHVLSGESGRTSGHLSNALDDGFINIEKKHGLKGAKAAADSHTYAINRVREISQKLGIDCEFRYLPAYEISQYARADARHAKEIENVQREAEFAKKLGMDVTFNDDLAVRGWHGKPDQRGGAIFNNQATFHPTKYMLGVLEWLRKQPTFQCFANTKMISAEDGEPCQVKTADGYRVTAQDIVGATCVPLQRKLNLIAEMAYDRTYCVAMRIPKGSAEDCLIYDEAEAYKYVRLTHCDAETDYIVVGGCDHKVGQETAGGRYEELETWVRERFPQAGSVDYKWSGQIFEPVDYMAFIGQNQGKTHMFIVTGDSGNGLTHGVLAGKLIADQIQGVKNAWTELYNPSRLGSIAKSLPSMLGHDVQINTQYKRYLQSDIKDIEDLVAGSGGVLHQDKMSKPVAVYKDDQGQAHTFSAVCPHLQGVVTWNDTEKSWDCPVHGSRFSCDGVCIEGPAKSKLTAMDTFSQKAQAAV